MSKCQILALAHKFGIALEMLYYLKSIPDSLLETFVCQKSWRTEIYKIKKFRDYGRQLPLNDLLRKISICFQQSQELQPQQEP